MGVEFPPSAPVSLVASNYIVRIDLMNMSRRVLQISRHVHDHLLASLVTFRSLPRQ